MVFRQKGIKKVMAGFSKEDSIKCKGFAILIMLFHHMYLGQDRYEGYEISFAPFEEASVNSAASFCKICVGIYVFISAYGLTVLYKKWKNSDSAFVTYRIIRMMFLYHVIYIVVLFLSFVIGKDWNIRTAYGGRGKTAAILYILIDFLGLARLFDTPTFNATWWYMSLAVILVFLIPILNRVYDKMGTASLIFMTLLLPRVLGSPMNDFVQWAFVLSLGVICARSNLLGVMKLYSDSFSKTTRAVLFLGSIELYYRLIFLRKEVFISSFLSAWDGIISFLTVCWLCLFINRTRIIAGCLMFFGRYSTLIFLTHTLIRYYWYRDFVYGQTSAWMNYLILLSVSLFVAVILELLLKIIQFERLQEYVCSKVMRYIAREQ